METRVRTPHDVFFAPQRLLVPLFQRPYVWSKEGQWQMLWDDIRRQADRMVATGLPPTPHFLGAVVIQTQPVTIGNLPQWTIIDGQQRLTTLQLAYDAAHQVLTLAGDVIPAKQVEDLVVNPAHFCKSQQDRFKVWPTNRDRPAFNEVMAAELPVDYDQLTNRASRMVSCHQFFAAEMSSWLEGGSEPNRGEVLAHILLTALQLVVIQLEANEDSQEIFETLNARGTPLTAADLIKNFVFQRLSLEDSAAEEAYQHYWHLFETAFWEREVGTGRNAIARSSLFLNQWLVAQTSREIGTRELFGTFKALSEHGVLPAMNELLPMIHESAVRYQGWSQAAALKDGALDRIQLFVYRTGALDSEITKSVLLWLTDPARDPIPEIKIGAVLACLESWLVRRALLRLSTQSLGSAVAQMLDELNAHPRTDCVDVVTRFLRELDAPGTYWPGDEELRRALEIMPVYKRMRRGRLRMILEAIEDHTRGYDSGKPSLTGQRVARDTHHIEHLLPQQWESNWSVGTDLTARTARAGSVHLMGNLTLLTSQLNSKVSNGPWLGATGKLNHLKAHDVMLMNQSVKALDGPWDEPRIGARTREMADAILAIWPVPAGHVGALPLGADRGASSVTVTVADLLREGLLEAGQELRARQGKFADGRATVLQDGSLQVGERVFETPSGAGRSVRKRATNGWHFWATVDGTRLTELRERYAADLQVEEVEVDDADDDADEAD
ncbi:DUF262 domain-containing protein [Kribbella sp. NPDC050241]|uniref:GmrSD restriction endonuclease domain-containing protein n=1 Tax=Kribbella sp. NPDC050241 TaxID=3364115 RepID=UPI0037A0FA65